MSFAVTSFKKPTKPRTLKDKKPMNRIGRKGEFWNFCGAILTRFFLKIEMAQRCEKCDGMSYCGRLTPAHVKRRNGIRTDNWYDALRVACLGNACHYEIDSQGGPAQEPILEKIIVDRFRKMGLSEERVKELLLECAAEIQAEDALKTNPKYQQFLVIL